MDIETLKMLALERAWKDLENVGKTKSIDYLPILLITNGFKYSLEQAISKIDSRNEVFIIDKEPKCLSGAGLFVFCRSMFSDTINLEENKKILRQLKWKNDVDYVFKKITSKWFPPDHRIIPVIHDLYGDDHQ